MVCMRSISSAKKNREKPAVMIRRGTNIEMSILGPPIRITLAG
jgi:hypothetical protein